MTERDRYKRVWKGAREEKKDSLGDIKLPSFKLGSNCSLPLFAQLLPRLQPRLVDKLDDPTPSGRKDSNLGKVKSKSTELARSKESKTLQASEEGASKGSVEVEA